MDTLVAETEPGLTLESVSGGGFWPVEGLPLTKPAQPLTRDARLASARIESELRCGAAPLNQSYESLALRPSVPGNCVFTSDNVAGTAEKPPSLTPLRCYRGLRAVQHCPRGQSRDRRFHCPKYMRIRPRRAQALNRTHNSLFAGTSVLYCPGKEVRLAPARLFLFSPTKIQI